MTASVIVRASGHATRFPIQSVLEAPQRSLPPSPVEICVTRLPWDALEVRLETGDGIAAPGSIVPVSLGFNILTPEPEEIALRYTAELRPIRGGEVLWSCDQLKALPSNAARPDPVRLDVPAPREEGTYVLEVRTTWEPAVAREGSRLSRLIHRRRAATPVTVVRQVSLVVMGDGPPRATATPGGTGTIVDVVDLSRVRGGRASASGRSPEAEAEALAWNVPPEALVESTRHDRLTGLIPFSGPEMATLPPVDANGLAWSALGMKVAHPGQPHRLTLTVTGGDVSGLAVALIAPGSRPRLLLDATAPGGAGAIAPGSPPLTFSWPVWPDAPEPVVVLANRGASAVRLGAITLTELPAEPAPASLAETHPEAPRALGLFLAGPRSLERFGGTVEGGGPADALAEARHLAAYLQHVGATLAVLPEGLADRSRREALDGQAGEDAIGPDRLGVVLRVLARRNLSAVLDLRLDSGPLPGLPAPETAAARQRGLVRLNGRGEADGPAYNPIHPDVRAALQRRVAEAIAPRTAHPNLQGVLIRIGPGPTVLGLPDTGLDDQTFARFVAAKFDPDAAKKVPGLGGEAANRFALRQQFLAGPGRLPWLSWRAQELGGVYRELARAVAKAAPGASLVVSTPVLDDGPAGQEARRGDRAGLPPLLAWRAVGLDLDAWPSGDGGPVVLRDVPPRGMTSAVTWRPTPSWMPRWRVGRIVAPCWESRRCRRRRTTRSAWFSRPRRRSPVRPATSRSGTLWPCSTPAGSFWARRW